MKTLLLSFILILLYSCESKPYINHSMKVDKIGDCSQQKEPINIKIISNINGERYEFDYCLAEGFGGKDYSLIRVGDTLVLDLPEPVPGNKRSLFKLTLDIDAYPKYGHLKLGNKVLDIILAGN